VTAAGSHGDTLSHGDPLSGGDTLLDVNVVVALLDPAHVHHDRAHAWLSSFRAASSGVWATSPIVENGFVRVVSNPRYAGRRATVRQAVAILGAFTASPDHAFWPDAISVLDASHVDCRVLVGHLQVTDAYLLALAVHNGGRLVTFDRSIPVEAVRRAKPDSLLALV